MSASVMILRIAFHVQSRVWYNIPNEDSRKSGGIPIRAIQLAGIFGPTLDYSRVVQSEFISLMTKGFP